MHLIKTGSKAIKTYYACLTDSSMGPTALKVSLVVGSLLFAINHGSSLMSRNMSRDRWISGGLTFVVPYLVSIHGQCSGHSQRKRQNYSTGQSARDTE